MTARLVAALRRAWRHLREWSGDAAYETYRTRARETPLLGREQFYLDSVERKYRQPNRCC